MRPSTIVPRAAAAALAAVTLVALAGCGDSGGVGGATTSPATTSATSVTQTSAAAATTSAAGPVSLTYWTWFPSDTTLNKVIAAYESSHPGVTITLREFEAADYQKQLPLALSGGEQIDIVGVQVSAMTNTVNTLLRPVSAWESYLPAGWRDQLEAKPLEQAKNVSQDKVLYDIPMGSMGSAVMYYNAALLSELNIAVPKTLPDLAAAAKAIAKAKPDITPVVNAGDPYWQEEMLFSIACQTNPTLSDDIFYNGTPWNDPRLVQALEDYKAMFTSGAVDVSTLSLKSPRPTELFTSGQAAFYFDGSWQNSLLSAAYRTANKIALTDVGAAGVPAVQAQGTPCLRAFAEGGLAIPTTSQHVEQAADFIAYMTMGDGVSLWAPDLVLSPSKKGFAPGSDVLASPAAQNGYQAVAQLINAAQSNRDSNQDFLNSVEGNAILDVLHGTKTAQQAADDMQQQWTSGRYPH